jgi:HD-GYP domain-containing protein (c-di-GMP phosphodiesterase class II)
MNLYKDLVAPAEQMVGIDQSESLKHHVSYGGGVSREITADGRLLQKLSCCNVQEEAGNIIRYKPGTTRTVTIDAICEMLDHTFDSIINLDTREKMGSLIDFCSSLHSDGETEPAEYTGRTVSSHGKPDTRKFLHGIENRFAWQPYQSNVPVKGRPGLQCGVPREEMAFPRYERGRVPGPERESGRSVHPSAGTVAEPLTKKEENYRHFKNFCGDGAHFKAPETHGFLPGLEKRSILQPYRGEDNARSDAPGSPREGTGCLLPGSIFTVDRIEMSGDEGTDRVVNEVRGGEKRFNEEEGSENFRRRNESRSPVKAEPGLLRPGIEALEEAALRQVKQDNLDIRKKLLKNEESERAREDVEQLAAAQKEIPVRQAAHAVKHAVTSIESILKKSQSETWTGDEMAAKLIYLLMKASSTFTFEHSSRVIDLSMELANELGITDNKQLKEIEEGAMFHDIGEVELDLSDAPPREQSRLARYLGVMDLKNCSFLHDIGKVKIPDSILYKPGRLSDEEFEVIKQHPLIGEAILKPIPSMKHVLPVVRHHHEKWDGSGYPDGLKSDAIPLSARIIGLTDAYDAMVSDRPYRKGMPRVQAVEELKRCAGIHFDPDIVKAFLRVLERESD